MRSPYGINRKRRKAANRTSEAPLRFAPGSKLKNLLIAAAAKYIRGYVDSDAPETSEDSDMAERNLRSDYGTTKVPIAA